MDMRIKGLFIVGFLTSLNACTPIETDPYGYNPPAYGNMRGQNIYQQYHINSRYFSEYYSPSSYTSNAYRDYYYDNEKPQPTVPDSYYTGSYRSPTSFKDTDKSWVKGQNPQGYTIEIANEEKPATVAGKLVKVPKNDRRAQIPYQQNGKKYYKGVYGSFESQEAAKKALEALPQEVKQGASVQGWGNVQNGMDE